MRRLWALGKLWNSMQCYMQEDPENIDKIDKKLIEGIFKTNMSDVQFLKKKEDCDPSELKLDEKKSKALVRDLKSWSKASIIMKSESS